MSSGWETISGDRRVLVLLDAQTAVLLPEQVAALRRQGAITRVVDYRQLMGQVDALRQTVQRRRATRAFRPGAFGPPRGPGGD